MGFQEANIAQPAPKPTIVIDGQRITSPAEVLQATRSQRSELRNQLDRAEERRSDLRQELIETPGSEVGLRKGLEARITTVDQQIADLETQLVQADAAVARAAGVPGANVTPPPPIRQGPPEEAFVLGGMFIFVVLLPLSIAFARRIWRRSTVALAHLPAELADRLTRIEMAVDAIAVEVERVGEGQRYMTNLVGDNVRALSAGAAEPMELKAREAELRRR
jgi:hypothetical protein